MILDGLGNLKKYEMLAPGLNEAIQKIKQLSSYKEGVYQLDNGYYMIQKGMTKPCEEGCFETHEKYIDVQILLEGQEMLEWKERNKLKVMKTYDESKDVQFYQGVGSRVLIQPGMCYILFPEDAHKACCHESVTMKYTKAVLKIKNPFL